MAFVMGRSLATGLGWAVMGPRNPSAQRGLEAWVGPLPWADLVEAQSLQGPPGPLGKVYRMGQSLVPPRHRRWIEQRKSAFVPWHLSVPGPTLWSGYWQSWRYLAPQEEALRRLLRFQAELNPTLSAWKTKAQSLGSTAVHIRRTDYLTSQDFVALSSEYYVDALNRLEPNGPVLVFSDDPVWCREQLQWPVAFEVVEGGLPEEDLYLMSLCQHHIIANSTFSWWAAWLGHRDGGSVYAPETWFPTYGRVPPLDDIYPPDWNLVPVEKRVP